MPSFSLAPMIRLWAVLVLLLGFSATSASALSIIRDAETERFLAKLSAPLFQAAGLGQDAVDIVIVNDEAINAMVAGGANMFINTGLIVKTNSLDELAGVIAHEIGHITGGHLIRTKTARENIRAKSLISSALGLGAAVLAGNSDVGQASILGSQLAAEASILQYSRAQESIADQTAVTLLDAAGMSSVGLPSFLNELAKRDYLRSSNPYWRTHPLSQERVRQLKDNVNASRNRNRAAAFERVVEYQRVKAKLLGFLQTPDAVGRRYSVNDRSIPALYARASNGVRNAPIAQTLTLIDQLLAQRPQDPYFWELRGQALFEHGQVDAAWQSYNQALNFAEDDPVMLASSAQVLLAKKSYEATSQALNLLNRALLIEPTNAGYWRLMSIGYSDAGARGLSALAMAESGLAMRQVSVAVRQAKRAQGLLEQNSPSWLRAKDIEYQARLL